MFLWRLPIQNQPKAMDYWEKKKKAKYLTWNSIRLKFVKKTSMPKSAKNLVYITWCRSRSPRPVKSPSNSIRYNRQKICSWSRRPKAILEIKKRPHFYRWPTILFSSFPTAFLTTERRLTGWYRLFPNILKYRDHQWDLQAIWKKRPLQKHIEEFS